jgi:hypothetical protein
MSGCQPGHRLTLISGRRQRKSLTGGRRRNRSLFGVAATPLSGGGARRSPDSLHRGLQDTGAGATPRRPAPVSPTVARDATYRYVDCQVAEREHSRKLPGSRRWPRLTTARNLQACRGPLVLVVASDPQRPRGALVAPLRRPVQQSVVGHCGPLEAAGGRYVRPIDDPVR